MSFTHELACLSMLMVVAGVMRAAPSPSPKPQSKDPPTAETLLAAMEAKLGPAEKRAAVKTLVVNGALTGPMLPGKATFESIFVGTDVVRLNFTYGAFGSGTWGTDGKMSWSTDPAMGVTIRRGEEQAPVHHLFALLRQAPWTEQYKSATLVGPDKVADAPAWKLSMTPKVGAAETWFIDQASGLLARADLSLPNPTGGTLPMRWYFADWKDVDGLLRPHKRVQSVAGMDLTYAVAKIETNGDVKPERYAVPTDVMHAAIFPAKRAPVAPDKGGECVKEVAESRPTATIRLKIKPSEVSKTLAIVLPEVGRHMAKCGATATSPPFSRYHSVSDDEIDIEAGICVAKPIEAGGRVKASELPGGPTAMTWHVGQYSDLMKTHALLEAWMKEQKLKARGGVWEIYWTDPGLEPDPTKWKTQLICPVE